MLSLPLAVPFNPFSLRRLSRRCRHCGQSYLKRRLRRRGPSGQPCRSGRPLGLVSTSGKAAKPPPRPPLPPPYPHNLPLCLPPCNSSSSSRLARRCRRPHAASDISSRPPLPL